MKRTWLVSIGFFAVIAILALGQSSALEPCPCNEAIIPNCDFENDGSSIPHWSTWQVLLRNERYVVRDWWSNNPWAAGDQGWWNDASVTQTITIPANADKLRWYVGYWWHSADGNTQGPFQYNVRVSILINGQYLVNHQTPPSSGGLMEWDISQYRGQTVSLALVIEGDGNEWANLYSDWVDISADTTNYPPVLQAIGDRSVDEGQGLAFTVAASDVNGDPLVYSAEGVPEWATFDQATGQFSGTPGFDDAGVSTVVFTVSDGTLSDDEAIVITVQNVNRPPVIEPMAVSGLENEELTFTASATDPDGDILSYSWDFDNDGTWEVSDSASPTASHVFADDSDGPIVLGVDDGTVLTKVNVPVTIANVAPTLGLAGAATVEEGAIYTLYLSATDPGADTIGSWKISWGDGTDEVVEGNPSSAMHTYADGPVTCSIAATATDEDGTYDAGNTVAVSVSNVDPIVGIAGPGSADEGTAYSLTLSATDPGADTIQSWTIAWGDGTVETVAGNPDSVAHTYADGPGNYRVSAQATDDDGAYDAGNTIDVAVTNVAPTLTLAGSASVDEGTPYTLTLGSADPGADTIASWTIDWGDGTIETVAGDPASAAHTYSDGAAAHEVSATATDEDGTFTAGNTVDVTVNNVVPTLAITGAASVNEGSTYTLTLGSTDPGADAITSWKIDWGDGAVETVSGDSASTAHVYADGPNSYLISASATDEDGTFPAGASVGVTVTNVAPSLGPIVPVSPLVPLAQAAQLSATFADPGADVHTASFAWGDGTESAGVVNEGAKSVSGLRTYPTPGVYPVTLTLRDDDGASGQEVYEYIVVYDPSGGFATGAGSIESPPGAYQPDQALSGKAHFGFVSKYKQGATVPDGHAQFQFQAADMKFQSTALQWLVVAGSKAQFKGTGTINGNGNYGFMLTATDGGNKGTDRFRIKIWEVADDELVYDNQHGSADTTDPVTAIENGNIVVHK